MSVGLQSYFYMASPNTATYENLVKHYTTHGLAVWQHGNLKRLPANTLPEAIVEHIAIFTTNVLRPMHYHCQAVSQVTKIKL